MKLIDQIDNRVYLLFALGALFFILIGVLAGYYIGFNQAAGYYLPKIAHCVVLPV